MEDTNLSVTRRGRADVKEVTDVLCDAFFDYPVMRYVLGSRVPEYERRLENLIRFFVMARVCRDEMILGISV